MYSLSTIQDFLLAENLINTETIILGDYEATSINRRNYNIQITSLKEENYLIKQVSNLESENANTLKKEARFYEYFGRLNDGLKTYLPEVKYVDVDNIILVMQYYNDSIPLWRYYNKLSIDHFPIETTKEIGRLLAQIHRSLSNKALLEDQNIAFLNDELPFIFNLNKPHPKILSYITKGGYDFIEHLQNQQDIMLAFNRIPQLWEKNSIIHGDIKLDNFLVLQPDHSNNRDLKLIDWEMAQIGDTAWDLAGVFNDFIFWWVITMPDKLPPEEMVKKAKFPFHKLHPAINAFWSTYTCTLDLDHEHQRELLERVLLFAGFRVLQTAYEVASKFDAIPSIATVLLNMGKSIIRKPEFSKEKLFGITEPETLTR